MNDHNHRSNIVLIVDDTPADLEVVLDILSHAGYDVRPVTSGQQALKLLQTSRPELILLDIQMPDMDGFETCRQIKANGDTAHIPIIFLTVFSDEATIATGFDLGAIDHITKPFKHAELLARVRTHIQLHRLTQNLEQRVLERIIQVQLLGESEQRLQNLVAGTAATMGKDFFPALVRHISQALDIAYVIVSEYKGHQLCTLAFWANGVLHAPLCYHPVKTPCERTLAEGEYCCPNSVQHEFPDALGLVDMQAESYYGIALSNAHGTIIGEFCLLHTQPLTDAQRLQIHQILRVFGARTAAELERQRVQTDLEALNQTLEAKVAERTVLIQRHLRTIEASIDGISILREDHYVFLNQSQLALFEYEHPDDVLGQSWQFLCHEEEIERFEREILPHVKQEGDWRGETLGKCRDGTGVAVEISLTLTPHGDIIQVCRDIRDRKQAEEKLQRTLAQLEASNQELESFAYSISHDLRAPIRAINGFSQALLEDYGDQFDDDARYFFDRICANTHRMSALIDDLLRLSRVSRSELRYISVDLSRLAEEILDDLHNTESARHVTIVVASGVTVAADHSLMQVVMMNLLHNAWKFTSHHSTARIEFGRLPAGSQASSDPIFFVKDDGVGFDMTYSHKLFGIFQRLHSIEEFPGTGIGLATVQRVIHRHGGRVWAEAAVEQGATFFFTVPQIESPNPERH